MKRVYLAEPLAMLNCPVCGTQNNDLAVTCFSCRSYLQSRVDALDLFETIWRVVESPAAAFRRIALASHKTYVLILAMAAGISVNFHVLWLIRASDRIPNFFILLLSGILLGPPVGLLFVTMTSGIGVFIGKRLNGTPGWRNTFSVCAYSSVPLVFSFVFVFPVELGVFGATFFGANPPPWILKPEIWYILLSLNGLALIWWFFLQTTGYSVVNGFSKGRAAAVTGAVCAILAAGVILTVG